MLVQQALEILHTSENTEDWCLLQVDLSNAFNSVSRQRVIHQVAKEAPHLLPWVQSLYGEELSLYLGHEKVASRRSVQQGCNFGTFLFALAIQPIIHVDTTWLSRCGFPGGTQMTGLFWDHCATLRPSFQPS